MENTHVGQKKKRHEHISTSQKDSRGERYRHCHQKEKTDDDDDEEKKKKRRRGRRGRQQQQGVVSVVDSCVGPSAFAEQIARVEQQTESKIVAVLYRR